MKVSELQGSLVLDLAPLNITRVATFGQPGTGKTNYRGQAIRCSEV